MVSAAATTAGKSGVKIDLTDTDSLVVLIRCTLLVGYLTNAYTPAMLAVAECDFGLRAKDRARTRQLNTRDDQGRYGGHINDMVRAGKWQVMKALEKEEPFLLVVGPGIHPELFDEKPSMYWVDQVKAPKGGGFHGKELKAAGKLWLAEAIRLALNDHRRLDSLDEKQIQGKVNHAVELIRDPTEEGEIATNLVGIPKSGVIGGLAFLFVYKDGRIVGRFDLVEAFKRKIGMIDLPSWAGEPGEGSTSSAI